MTPTVFEPGSTVVRCDVRDGKVWTAAPHRILADDGHQLVLVTWPGIAGYTLANWIKSLTGAGEQARRQAVTDLVDGDWELGRWIWRDTIVVTWIGLDPDFSLQHYQPVDGSPGHWKINFERPVTRRPAFLDTCDLLLDLITDPGGSTWRWKDEEEYEQIRQAGLVPDDEHERVQAARQRALAFAEAGRGPLAEDWTTWQVPADWPLPTLPDGVLTTHP
jgi:hypothetical protein